MPALRCTAINCLYNREELCSRGDIEVRGDHAEAADETCCASFLQRTEDAGRMSCGCGRDAVRVGCTACECRFNEEAACCAGAVAIGGSSACTCGETCCGTFQRK